MNSVGLFRETVRIDLSKCQYEILYEVAKELKWETEYEHDCDIIWQDSALTPMVLSQLNPFQRINHLPGVYAITHKDYLAKHLKLMESLHPAEFNFFPNTWVLPQELTSLKKFIALNQPVLICKPPNSSQGKGIFLTKWLNEIPQNCIVQKYLEDPFLIEGYKFDLRLYVLVTGIDPLRAYIHEEGLVRLATNSYCRPTDMNMQNVFMHLTNYAINKSSPNYIFNKHKSEDFIGHKRSFKALLKQLEEDGRNTEKLLKRINDVVLKTLCTVQPFLAHAYRCSQPNDTNSAICFQILGFDIFLDSKLRPQLLEVNHTPSFTVDSPLDKLVKRAVLKDCLLMIGVQADCRNKFHSEKTNYLIRKTYHSFYKVKNMKYKEKQEFLKNVTDQETCNQGGFKKLLTEENQEVYESYMKDAEKIFSSKRVSRPIKVKEKPKNAEVKLLRRSTIIPSFQHFQVTQRRKSCAPRVSIVPKIIKLNL